MSLPVRLLMLFVIAVVAALSAQLAVAQSSVETYFDPAAAAQSVEGDKWGRPLKAGELTLQEPVKEIPSLPPLPRAKNLPVGSIQAPKIEGQADQPLLVSPNASSKGVMLMQGLKNALHQAGQNADLTKTQTASNDDSLLKAPTLKAPERMSEEPAALSSDYVPGQQPRNLAEIEGFEAQTLEAELSPKATDLEQAPASLEESVQSAARPKASAKASIFGSPIDDSSSVPESKAAKVLETNPEKNFLVADAGKLDLPRSNCEPSVKPWAKECSEAGYPVGYTGKITGETRVECPNGDVRDVWLNNTCTMGASAKPAAEEPLVPLVTEMKEAPKPIAEVQPPVSEKKEQPPVEKKKKGKSKKKAKKEKAAEEAAPSLGLSGKCGSANGTPVALKPFDDMCATGRVVDVRGEGPWTWTCEGADGGMSVSCAAPKADAPAVKEEAVVSAEKEEMQAPEDAKCGPSSGVGTREAPEEKLCEKGIASRVNGDGPWTWACSGINGGKASVCSAPKSVNGTCGDANKTSLSAMPESDLCKTGYASAVTGKGPWSWTCGGLHGGEAAVCSASLKADGVCGAASLKGHREEPKAELCRAGEASSVKGSGPWRWSCEGANGGSDTSCAAAIMVDGACGAANGNAFDSAPEKDLCLEGAASPVSGPGPWHWSCAGADGGNAATCAAVMTEKAASEKAVAQEKVEKMPSPEPVPAPAAAAAEPVDVDGPVCGASSKQGLTGAPKTELCSVGKASKVRGSGPWTWTCSKKTLKVGCTAEKWIDAVCGSANGSIYKTMPTKGLCSAGTASAVEGAGPWQWGCVGAGGGVDVSCSAGAMAQPKVDGICGAATSMPASVAPTSGLCESGTASKVNGGGPWTWTCSGEGGGVAVICKADIVMAKAPPPPGPAINGVCGPANGAPSAVGPSTGLCSSGTPTAMSGVGPWNWSCIGANGGMSVSCTAPVVPPMPVTGACGSANGVPTPIMPRSGLCSAGISSAVSGKGPWTWSCSGTNGGAAVGCVAPFSGGGGAMPSMVTPSAAGSLEDEESFTPPPPVASPSAHSLTTPRLPTDSMQPLGKRELDPLMPYPVRDMSKSPLPKKPPAVDKNGEIVPGARLELDSDVAEIEFDSGSDQLDDDAIDAVNKLADVLLKNATAHITLVAYADGKTMSPRESRRLSLARALAVRDYLTVKGVPSSRVDVRAMGVNVPSGDPNRIDVKVD